jgi:hypothetical protein
MIVNKPASVAAKPSTIHLVCRRYPAVETRRYRYTCAATTLPK